jgi:hypothetical protein
MLQYDDPTPGVVREHTFYKPGVIVYPGTFQ